MCIRDSGEAEFQMKRYHSALTYAFVVYLSYSRNIVSQSWLGEAIGYTGGLEYALSALKPKDLRPFLGDAWTFADWFSLWHHLHIVLHKANVVRYGADSTHAKASANLVAGFAGQLPNNWEFDWTEEKWAIIRKNATEKLYEQVGVRQP